MGAKLGIQMIDMYCQLVYQEFRPILDSLRARRQVEEHNCEIDVRKELGIYDLTTKRMKLKAQLDEIERQLRSYEKAEHYGQPSKIEKIVKVKMAESKNGILKEAEMLQMDLIRRIKLSGVTGDVKEVFDEIPKLIAPLEKKIKALPKPKKVKKLTI
jgi:hypothetical protein